MPEADRYLFELREVAEILVKQQGIHQGIWGVYIEFGLGAANVPVGPEGNRTLTPAALTFIQKIGIQTFAEANNLTVNAAEVNPATSKATKKAAKKGAKK